MTETMSFGDFPDDVQLCVLSFLRPSDLAAFACTCKRFDALYRHDQRLWFSLCHRRWGSKTLIHKWGGGRISYRQLYRFLNEYDSLIGFWRCCGDAVPAASAPPLVFFQWGPYYITGSRVSPSKNSGYEVIQKPFLWMSISSIGEMVNYLDQDGRAALTAEDLMAEPTVVESELIQVNVSFIGDCHMVVEEENLVSSRGEECDNVYGSPPDRLMTEIYQYFANRTSPGGSRRQRRREKEKEKQGRMRKWEPQHFVKIVNCSPKASKPLQGLWKVVSPLSRFHFYLLL